GYDRREPGAARAGSTGRGRDGRIRRLPARGHAAAGDHRRGARYRGARPDRRGDPVSPTGRRHLADQHAYRPDASDHARLRRDRGPGGAQPATSRQGNDLVTEHLPAAPPAADQLVPAPGRPRLTVIGEALIDLVPGSGPGDYQARPGGSPFNVAIGLVRLDHRTTLMARLADNAFGRQLREHAAAEGVDLSNAPQATEPTTLAVVSLDAEGHAGYDFYLQG